MPPEREPDRSPYASYAEARAEMFRRELRGKVISIDLEKSGIAVGDVRGPQTRPTLRAKAIALLPEERKD